MCSNGANTREVRWLTAMSIPRHVLLGLDIQSAKTWAFCSSRFVDARPSLLVFKRSPLFTRCLNWSIVSLQPLITSSSIPPLMIKLWEFADVLPALLIKCNVSERELFQRGGPRQTDEHDLDHGVVKVHVIEDHGSSGKSCRAKLTRLNGIRSNCCFTSSTLDTESDRSATDARLDLGPSDFLDDTELRSPLTQSTTTDSGTVGGTGSWGEACDDCDLNLDEIDENRDCLL
ncbi:hypothetical protein OGAPHI_003140 [Ogataea philodendri]|uniref:Uncharacterized protein n=1 Tax=Ogataea philodendri TaxID=1378263 RepID=A0A9P8T711_9ASCO|nr:uncharacterized protein OGAPHI_003140 [Ogataea philodendri]KAH3667491.1 hypothetical protein OGAPHI_003140 [Ogataea philodendri]